MRRLRVARLGIPPNRPPLRMKTVLRVRRLFNLGAAFAAAGFAALAFACSESQTPAPPASASAAPTHTPTPPAAHTPTPEPADAPTPAPTPTPAAPSVISHSASVSDDNSLIVFVTVALSAPARVAVEYENEYAGKFRTALSERAAVEHRVPVARLRADAVYQYAVGVETADGALAYGARGEFAAGALPDALAVPTETTGRSSLKLIFSTYSLVREQMGRHLFMRDELGEVVWSFQEVGEGISQFARFQPNSDLIYIRLARGDNPPRVVRATPLGDLVYAVPFDGDRAHHDLIVLNGESVLYAGAYKSGMDVDTINLISPLPAAPVGEVERIAAERVWDARDFGMNLNERVHLNSISPSLDGGWLASLRNPSQIISISEDFQTVRWRLGGSDGDFAFPDPADMFSRQHTASQLPNGNILLFDNQAGLPAPDGDGYYSRALELRLDFDAMTAVKAWEYSPEPRLHSRIAGSAYRLDNGNTLINFGHPTPDELTTTLVEVDARGRELFRLATDAVPRELRFNHYRALPGPESVIGETMLRPPKER